MKKRWKKADEEVWCPECEKMDKHVRLEEGCCPECHYSAMSRRGLNA